MTGGNERGRWAMFPVGLLRHDALRRRPALLRVLLALLARGDPRRAGEGILVDCAAIADELGLAGNGNSRRYVRREILALVEAGLATRKSDPGKRLRVALKPCYDLCERGVTANPKRGSRRPPRVPYKEKNICAARSERASGARRSAYTTDRETLVASWRAWGRR